MSSATRHVAIRPSKDGFAVAGFKFDPSGTDTGDWVARETDPPAITHWVDPDNGDNSNGGTSKSDAWATFAYAITQVGGTSGTVVIGVPDARYVDHVESNSYACYIQGLVRTSAEPLWIRSETERGAIFEAQADSTGAVYLFQCEHVYVWGITGIGNGSSANASSRAIFEFGQCENIEVYRCLGANTAAEQYVYRFDQGSYGYFEECEGYEGINERYRHVFSFHRSTQVHAKRCYSNRQNAPAGTGFIAYRASDVILDNCIDEYGGRMLVYGEEIDSTSHSRRVKLNGLIMMDGRMMQMDTRGDGGSHAGFEAEHCLFIDLDSDGLRAATNAGYFDHCTWFNCGTNSGRAGIHVAAYPEAKNSTLISIQNSAILDSGGASYSEYDDGDAPYTVSRTFSYLNVHGGAGGASWDGGLSNQQNVLDPRNLSDAAFVANLCTNSINSDPISGAYGHPTIDEGLAGSTKTLIRVPSGNVQSGAGSGGSDIGCEILYRYNSSFNGSGEPVVTLTTDPLWNPATGEFPSGALVAGVNDGEIRLENLHKRLGVNPDTLPAGYGT